MKKLLSLCVVTVGLAACGPIELAAQKKVAFSVHATDATSYEAKKTFDLASDPDFADFKDNLKGMEVTSATLRVTRAPSETPSNCTTSSGTLTVSADEASQGTQFAAYDVAVSEGTTLDLTPDAAGKAELSRLALGDAHKFTVTTSGTADQAPCHFDFEVVLDLTATAEL